MCGSNLALTLLRVLRAFAVNPPKPIYLIAAVARNGVIGRAGRLPWDLPEDWRHFVVTTRGGILIHGRKCQDHHGPPLPGREVIVLTRDPDYQLVGVRVARSLPEALQMAQASPHPGPIWIGGGAGIYKEALPLAEKVYVTEIALEPAGDTFLPWKLMNEAGFTRVLSERPGAPGPVAYKFKVLARA